MIGDRPLHEAGIGGLARAVLERAVRDASAGRPSPPRQAFRKGTFYAWAVLPPGPADRAYAWLLGDAHLWLNILDIDPDYFGRLVYEGVEECRLKEALSRCERVGRVLEGLCGV